MTVGNNIFSCSFIILVRLSHLHVERGRGLEEFVSQDNARPPFLPLSLPSSSASSSPFLPRPLMLCLRKRVCPTPSPKGLHLKGEDLCHLFACFPKMSCDLWFLYSPSVKTPLSLHLCLLYSLDEPILSSHRRLNGRMHLCFVYSYNRRSQALL